MKSDVRPVSMVLVIWMTALATVSMDTMVNCATRHVLVAVVVRTEFVNQMALASASLVLLALTRQRIVA